MNEKKFDELEWILAGYERYNARLFIKGITYWLNISPISSSTLKISVP